MDKSESINELAGALSKFQGEVKDVSKDKKGYGYQYADLSQVLEIARPLLSKHGLAMTQLTGAADDRVTVETVLMHNSGQWISGTIHMPAERGKGMSGAQAVGSIITYARRYGAVAILGITQTDDDASAHIPQIRYSKPVEPNTVTHIAPISPKEELKNLIAATETSDLTVSKWLAKAGVNSLDDLGIDITKKIIVDLKQKLHDRLSSE